MRLEELQKAPSDVTGWRKDGKSSNNWHLQLDDLLSKYGYKGIGKGGRGSVYRNPNSKKVIKIFSRDSYYMSWVEFAKAHPNNPWVPKFRSNLIALKKLGDAAHTKNIPSDIFAIAMEELTPSSSDSELAFIIVVFMNNYKDPDWDPSVTSYYKEFKQLRQDPQFMEVVEFLAQHEDYVDLAAANIMLRGNQPVITDPLAE